VSAASPPRPCKKRKDGAPSVPEWEENQESRATPEICGPLHRGFLTKGSNCGSHMRDQIANALRQFDDFAFSPQFEINLIVACRRVIDRVS
jgi:hypothetical protein